MSIRADSEYGLTSAQRSGILFFRLGLMSFFLWAAMPASAGMVSGEVRENGRNLPNTRIELKDSMNNRYTIRTDKNGRYRANLPPGIYRATRNNDERKRALIQSSPQPSQQNIDFDRR